MSDEFESLPYDFTATSDTRRYRGMKAKKRPVQQRHEEKTVKKTHTNKYTDRDFNPEDDLDIIETYGEKIPRFALFCYPIGRPGNSHSYGICFISRQLNTNGFPSVLAVRQRTSHSRYYFGFPKGKMERRDKHDTWRCAVREVFHEELYVPFDPPTERPSEYKKLQLPQADAHRNKRRFIHIFFIRDIDKTQNFRVRDHKELHQDIQWFDIDNADVLGNKDNYYFTMYRFVKMLHEMSCDTHNGQ